MPADDSLLFIDANKYLDLYRTDKGKKLLSPLAEQAKHIFVTKQVVSEVQRNKILVAAGFLGEKFKSLKLQTFNVPDHLTGASTGHGKEILQQMSIIAGLIAKVNSDVDKLAMDILEQISHSADEVSVSLAPIFVNAVLESEEELSRARLRRELGNPPGKSPNPLGDQLSWEQILSNFNGKKRLWIISRDGDYGTTYNGKGFLNRFLFDELVQVSDEPEAYLFTDLVEGITHFVASTGVEAKTRLTQQEIDEIEHEEQALPPVFASSEDIRRMVVEIEGLNKPYEDMLHNLAGIAEINKPFEDLRRTMAEIADISKPYEELKRTVAEWNKPLEDLRRAFTQTGILRPKSPSQKTVEDKPAQQSAE